MRHAEAAVLYEYRVTREAEKAVAKYGEDALAPAGHPDKDVHDYCINELVGLERYGEMIEARLQLYDQSDAQRSQLVHEIRTGTRLAREIAELGKSLAIRLIAHRAALQELGQHLGEPENEND
jgi:hypothetical protein